MAVELRNLPPLGPKGNRLLRFLVEQIRARKILPNQPRTFIAYAEALRGMEIPARGRAGQQLQREGLNELDEWTKADPSLPKIAGLIVNKSSREPSEGFPKSHGIETSDWKEWWLAETKRAIEFDWAPFLNQDGLSAEDTGQTSSRVREDDSKEDYRERITIAPGLRGGRPCIRGMRIAVSDILGWLVAGMTEAEILDDFPELTKSDIKAALAFSRDRDEHTAVLEATAR